jgi:hypothetical protein
VPKAYHHTSDWTADAVLASEHQGLDSASNTSRLDGVLLQVLVIRHVGRNGVTDDIGGLLAIRLLPLGVELLVGLGDFLLRRLLADDRVGCCALCPALTVALGLRSLE